MRKGDEEEARPPGQGNYLGTLKPALNLDRLDRIARRLTSQMCAAGYKPSRLQMLLRRKDRLNRIRARVTEIK